MCNKTCLYVSSAIFCSLGFLFFLIGACGNSDDEKVIQDVPWASGYIGDGYFIEKIDVWLGLSAFYVDLDDSDDDYDDDDDAGGSGAMSYSDCASDSNWCEDCESAGGISLAMTCISLIFALVGLVTNILSLAGKDTTLVKVGSLFSTLISAILAIVAFIVFRPCMQAFVDEVGDFFGATLGYGTGAWMVLVGFVVMLLAAFLNSIALCCDCGADKGGAEATTGTSSL